MKFYELKIEGETEGRIIRLRVRMQDHAELDQLAGGNFLEAFRGSADSWALLKAMLVAGCHAAGDIKPTQADEVSDELIDGGESSEDAFTRAREIGTVSGFLTRSALERYREMMRKAQAEDETA